MQKDTQNHCQHVRSATKEGARRNLARMWPDFVQIETRMKTETPFILKHVPRRDAFIFDACLGCGATTIGLRLRGRKNILSNELDPDMREVAKKEAAARGIQLYTSSYNWRELTPKRNGGLGKFDLITCLGNSLTLVPNREGRLHVLKNFLGLLAQNGTLIIDERNYSRVYDGSFRHSGKYVYCGDKVRCSLVEVSSSRVVMEYLHIPTWTSELLEMFRFQKGELAGLLREAGFSQVQTFGDYKARYDPHEVEFYTHVARK
jgi:glycine/sarcosine N-methyltransferase